MVLVEILRSRREVGGHVKDGGKEEISFNIRS